MGYFSSPEARQNWQQHCKDRMYKYEKRILSLEKSLRKAEQAQNDYRRWLKNAGG